jgi:SAM-dependent methyltransferase
MHAGHRGGSPSLHQPDYWWYQARGRLLRTTFDGLLSAHDDGQLRSLDVGSADAVDSFWEGRSARVLYVDPDPRGLGPGGICAQLPELPFADSTFDVVTAFDVIEHCRSETAAIDEVFRVLAPGGLFLMSVPAYQWAWTDFDVTNGHHRRYTRRRVLRAAERSGFRPLRATHAFAAVFPAFAAQRVLEQLTERSSKGPRPTAADPVKLAPVSAGLQRLLLWLCRLDERALARHDLAFGSSILLAAQKPAVPAPATR